MFAGNPDDAPAIKERISALKGDMVFLALDRAATRAVRPYISGTLPIYTTSIGVDPRAEATVNVDLEGVRYVDMPWFVQPDHPAVMIYPAPQDARWRSSRSASTPSASMPTASAACCCSRTRRRSRSMA